MDWSLNTDQELAVESPVRLSGLVPVVNGVPIAEGHAEILRNDPDTMLLQFAGPALAGSTLAVEITRERKDRCWLRYWTANRPSVDAVDQSSVTLAPHDGALLSAGPSPILSAPEQLP